MATSFDFLNELVRVSEALGYASVLAYNDACLNYPGQVQERIRAL